MTREEFYKWLDTCPTGVLGTWFVEKDDFGTTTIRFDYEEVSNE
jgi:hypothetical protein